MKRVFTLLLLLAFVWPATISDAQFLQHRRRAFMEPPGGLTLIFHDEFTEAAATLIESHTPTPTGTSWTKVITGAGNDIYARASDTFGWGTGTGSGGDNTVGELATAAPAPTGAEYDIEVTVVALYNVANTDDPFHIVARYADVDNFYAVAVYQNLNASNLVLYKNVANVTSTLDTVDFDLNVNDVLKFEVRNATKKLYVNGVEKLTSADNDITAAGTFGIGIGNVGTFAGDDAQAGWALDDYEVYE